MGREKPGDSARSSGMRRREMSERPGGLRVVVGLGLREGSFCMEEGDSAVSNTP